LRSSAPQPPDSRSLLAQALAFTITSDPDVASLVEGLQGDDDDDDWLEELEAEEQHQQQDEQQQQQQQPYRDAGVAAGLGEHSRSQPALKRRSSPIPSDLTVVGSLAAKLQEIALVGITGMVAVGSTVCLLCDSLLAVGITCEVTLYSISSEWANALAEGRARMLAALSSVTMLLRSHRHLLPSGVVHRIKMLQTKCGLLHAQKYHGRAML
jgi:hypothetical protein